MKNYTFTYAFNPVPPIMKRGRHALIVVKNAEGKFLLGAKDIYPAGIYRFVGGGIDDQEDPGIGAAREVEEELQVRPALGEIKSLAKITAEVKNDTEQVTFETFLFFFDLGNRPATASDDIQSLVYLTKHEVLELADRYQKLSADLVNVGKSASDTASFRWSDYGQFYGEVHRIAMELVE